MKNISRRIHIDIMVVLLSKTELLNLETINILNQIILCCVLRVVRAVLYIVGCLATSLAPTD